MNRDARADEARQIMVKFAEDTGLLTTSNPPRRYLWTDAHAVCNYLSLYRRTEDEEYKRLAQKLIEQVHNILGRHREDDARSGWISGLGEEEGRNHPTAGGLRIGKKLNERGAEEAYDERLEWDRDGQYFHYLTKWMHALCRAAAVTGEFRYCRWAVELAKAAHAGFAIARLPDGKRRLVWKMSIDLTRPLVPSAGLHDPLDGFVTYNEIELCARPHRDDSGLPTLSAEIAETAAMNEGQRWETDDPLGIGGLLFDACRATQLIHYGQLKTSELLEALIRDAARSLAVFSANAPLRFPVEQRLAFRELGLSIGLQAIAKMRAVVESKSDQFIHPISAELDGLDKYIPLGEALENVWRDPNNWRVNSWREHSDINRVTLATSLLPDEFLNVHPPD